MSEQVFALPDVGEGLTEAEILRWLVQPGDVVVVNQSIVEIETAKAAVELPCPFAGVVEQVHVAEGAIVTVGSPIISIASANGAAPTTVDAQREAVLVGYGVRHDDSGIRRRRRAPRPDAVSHNGTTTNGAVPDVDPIRFTVRAKPLVRKLARDKGVDITKVTPTGLHGEVTRADVINAVGGEVVQASVSDDQPGERIPVRGVQRAMADAMVQSVFTAPHVTEWVDVDMTRSLELVRRLREAPANSDIRITPMVLVAAGLIRAARQYPRINSSWVDTSEGADVVIHREVNLGVAADTPRGLLVPIVRHASSLGLIELARRVQALIDTARAGGSTPADLTGGTISITNIGVFAVDGGTPIIYPGQSAILAMGRVLDRAWVVDGQIVARPIMQLAFSFDHRVIDGALGSRALQSVAAFLADPAVALAVDSGQPICS